MEEDKGTDQDRNGKIIPDFRQIAKGKRQDVRQIRAVSYTHLKQSDDLLWEIKF